MSHYFMSKFNNSFLKCRITSRASAKVYTNCFHYTFPLLLTLYHTNSAWYEIGIEIMERTLPANVPP
ncbi:Uncharacterised protein [Legionella pneumophila]|nr:Uncharacterised protein [Legionella pneumophila]